MLMSTPAQHQLVSTEHHMLLCRHAHWKRKKRREGGGGGRKIGECWELKYRIGDSMSHQGDIEGISKLRTFNSS